MANLDKAARDALPDEHFAVPGKRKLPIPDAHHTRLAWTQVDRTEGLGPDERRIAKERIKRRAHELGINTGEWHVTASIEFEAMALELPQVDGHPNRKPFKGVLTRIDQPSDAPPGGASGKRTFIPKIVAEAALPSLLGMAVDYTPGFEGHDRRSKIGLITGAEIVGDAIEIEGFFYAKDFPSEVEAICAEKSDLGFSYECDARIQDTEADIWTLSHCVFTGAAVLYKHLAAYTTTSLAAQAEQELEMTKEELQELLAAAIKPLATTLEAQGKELAEIKAKGASLGGPIVDQVKPHVEGLNAAAEAMEKAGVGAHPVSGHAANVRKIAAHLAAEAVSGRVPHVFRDHDYLPDARVEAGADKAATEKAIADAVAAAVKPLTEQLEAAKTKVTDLEAKAFKSAEAPTRSTVSPQIMTLLAKGGVKIEDVSEGKQLSVEQADKVLDAAGLTGQKRIEAKLKMRHEGLMEVGQR